MTPQDLQLFNFAVTMAQNGDKTAYRQLENLYKTYPYDPNLLLWLVYTAPAPSVAGKYLDKLKKINPNNSAIPAVEQWLGQQTTHQPPKPSLARRFQFVPALAALLATLVLAASSIYLFFDIQDFKANAIATVGTTVSYNRVYRRRGSDYYYPVVQFHAENGRDYRVTLPFSSYSRPANGTNYRILYHRNNPDRIETDNFSEDIAIMWGLGGGAVIFGLLTAVCIIGAVVVSKRRRTARIYQPPAPF